MSNQPVWKLHSQLGDAQPLEYGGYFIYVDQTGVYAPEGEILEVTDEDSGELATAHRFGLERCTFVNGILSDNKFHPEHPAWFAKPESERAERPQDTTYLKNIADSMGMSVESLIEMFCSEEVNQRAIAWRMVGEHHGFMNLDEDPLRLTEKEMRARYADDLKGLLPTEQSSKGE